MIGDLDAVSALLSNFFVASYALMNFAVFHVSVTHNPGWRPSFKVLKLLMYIESIPRNDPCLLLRIFSYLTNSKKYIFMKFLVL